MSSPAYESKDRLKRILLSVALLGLVAGLALHFAGQPQAARFAWAAGAGPVLLALLAEIFASLRRGELGLDLVAALSMSAALVFGENLAASVVSLMYAGGTFLESFAEGRARREMTALLERTPRTATRHRDGRLEEIPIDAIGPGDRLLVQRGHVVPADGVVGEGGALLDQAALTGESMPVRVPAGGQAMSGSTNAGDAFDLVATRPAAESTYAGIVRLVEAAQASKAPMSRLADRYALGFLALTVSIAGAAWIATGDPVRMVAVLVVATPCPLILAVPVALFAGMSRAAGQGVLVKGGRALEAMAKVQTAILDKTGTLTDGRPRIMRIETAPGFEENELLRLAASLDQASRHPVAQALVQAARERGLRLDTPAGASEKPGEGVAGMVSGRAVAVGATRFVASHTGSSAAVEPDDTAGAAIVAVAVDGRHAGRIVLADPLRADTAGFLAQLRKLGLRRIVLATGDRRDVAEAITAGLGLDAVRSELTPDQKVLLVLSESKRGPVMMVGDGVNDAPALAAADLGVAMGARGSAASAEAADVVLLADSLARLVPGLAIARRTRAIALQSVVAGIGMSVAGMLAAASGHLSPVQGAILQEVIDVLVILNAMRALR